VTKANVKEDKGFRSLWNWRKSRIENENVCSLAQSFCINTWQTTFIIKAAIVFDD